MINIIVILSLLLVAVGTVAVFRDGEYKRFEKNNKKGSKDKLNKTKKDKNIYPDDL